MATGGRSPTAENGKGARSSRIGGDVPFQLVSSRTRLKILDLLTRRPRTLRELSASTGISVQGVIRHLDALRQMGLIGERRIHAKAMQVRKLYVLKGIRVNDFSFGDLMVVRVAPARGPPRPKTLVTPQMENIASDLLVRRHVIRQRVRRIASLIDELADEESNLVASIEGMPLSEEDRLVLESAFTEETLKDAENTLRLSQGASSPGDLIGRALSRAKKIEKK